jgi:hypothetical protein
VEVAAVAGGLEPQPEAAVDDDLADEEEDDELIHSSGGDTASEASAASSGSASDAAPAGRGRGKGGRGRGRGRGGAKGRGRGKANAAGRGKGDAAAAGTKPSKYVWVDVSEHVFTERYEWDGEELPWLDPTFDGLTTKSAPHEWFQKMDAPEEEYALRAANSEKYRAHRFLHDLDGPGKKCYDGAGEMQYSDMRMMDAA